MDARTLDFTIGALAKASGVNAPAIRYYEEIGLLRAPSRGAGGQRRYQTGDLERLAFVKRCRDLGFGIGQVRMLLALSLSAKQDCAEARNLAQGQLEAVRAKLRELQALKRTLEGFVRDCDAMCLGGPAKDCSIFGTIHAAPCCG